MTTGTQSAEASKDFLGMSDEDFLKMDAPEVTAEQGETPASVDSGAAETNQDAEAKAGAEAEEENPDAGKDGDDKQAETPAAADVQAAADDKPGGDADPSGSATAAGDKADPVAKADAKDPKAEADKAGTKDGDKKSEEEAKPVDLQAFYNSLIGTPIKANGKTITLNSPDEVLRLVQMGAGYGRKIQDLQPHLKTIRMLEKNDLLDPDKLSFLIDINQKNPEAIKKIIKDSGIDPLDLNIGDNVSYTPKNHAVSDKEMEFTSVLEDVQSRDPGTITLINQTWDQESKRVLWEQPQLMSVIQSQRELGVYDQIVAEIDRQKLLGQIPHSTPFLQAYKLAGDHLQATNGFKISEDRAAQIQTQQAVQPQPQVIATRTAAPKAQVQNGDKATAAAPTKSATNSKATTTVNPLAMADDEFLKTFNGRL